MARATGALSVALPVAAGASVLFGANSLPRFLVFTPVALAFAIVGWLIVERRPGNLVGPLLLAFGFGVASVILADAYIESPGSPPGAAYVALLVNALDAPLFTIVALALVLFPDGELPTASWRWVFPLAAVASAGAIVGVVVMPGPVPMYPAEQNPLDIAGSAGMILAGIGYAGLVVLLVAGAVALATRWRRGNPLERAQIKWVGSAAGVLLAAQVVTLVTWSPGDAVTPATLIQMAGVTLVPVSMGVAILRYRLYDIDRVISRGLSYAIVISAMFGLFAGAVLLLQAALSGITQGQSLAVAASTLLAFAAFQPLRRRVQDRIDRRFDRARYDAQQTVDAFAGQLRNEVDLLTLRGALIEAADQAVRPAGAGVWLSPHATFNGGASRRRAETPSGVPGSAGDG